MTIDAAAAVAAAAWTVIDYQKAVLAHRITLAEALKIILETMDELNGWESSGRYWSLFTVASAQLDPEGWRPIEGGLYRKSSVSEELLERSKLVDVRDAVASDPALDVGGAAESIYAPFRNVDLCSVAYRDMGPLFKWPKNRVNHMATLDPAIERHVRERYAADLAAGTPVSVVIERTRLTHLDELHLWVFRQLFYFHASAPGRYKAPREVYGFKSSPFSDHVVLAWGCAPHAHEMAWGIAYGIDGDLPVDPGARVAQRRRGDIHLSPRFIEQIGALLQDARPKGEKERTKKGAAKKGAAKKGAAKKGAGKSGAGKSGAVKEATAKKATTKKTGAKKGAAKKAVTKKAVAKKAVAKGAAKKAVGARAR